MNLITVSREFHTEEDCLAFLEHQRWPEGVRCPICGNNKVSKVTRQSKSKNKRSYFYTCLEPTCRKQFSPTHGTIFHKSHIPLKTWFLAISIVVDAKKGVSALQLQTHLGIGSYRAAWFMVHRI